MEKDLLEDHSARATITTRSGVSPCYLNTLELLAAWNLQQSIYIYILWVHLMPLWLPARQGVVAVQWALQTSSLPFHRLQTRSPNTTEQCSRPKKFECESIIIYLKTNYDNGPRIKAKAKGDIGWTIKHDRATVSWKLLAGSLSKGDAWRGNPANCLGHDQWELVPWNHSVTVQAAWRMSGLGG